MNPPLSNPFPGLSPPHLPQRARGKFTSTVQDGGTGTVPYLRKINQKVSGNLDACFGPETCQIPDTMLIRGSGSFFDFLIFFCHSGEGIILPTEREGGSVPRHGQLFVESSVRKFRNQRHGWFDRREEEGARERRGRGEGKGKRKETKRKKKKEKQSFIEDLVRYGTRSRCIQGRYLRLHMLKIYNI